MTMKGMYMLATFGTIVGLAAFWLLWPWIEYPLYVLLGIYLAGFIAPLFKDTLLATGWWTTAIPGRALWVMKEGVIVRVIFNPQDNMTYYRNASNKGGAGDEYWSLANVWVEQRGDNYDVKYKVTIDNTDVPCTYAPLLWWFLNPLVPINWWLYKTAGLVWVGAFGLQTVSMYMYTRWKRVQEARQKGQTFDETQIIPLEDRRLVPVTDHSDHTRFLPFEIVIVIPNSETGDGWQVSSVVHVRLIVWNPYRARFAGADPSWIGMVEESFRHEVTEFISGLRLLDIFPFIHETDEKIAIQPAEGYSRRLIKELLDKISVATFDKYGVAVYEIRSGQTIPSPETLANAQKIPAAYVQRRATEQQALGIEAVSRAPLKAAREQVALGLDPELARTVVIAGAKGPTKVFMPGAGSGGLVKAAAATIVTDDSTPDGYPDPDALLASQGDGSGTTNATPRNNPRRRR